jgi:glycosyltransferase involved in cell wall biosynthesis
MTVRALGGLELDGVAGRDTLEVLPDLTVVVPLYNEEDNIDPAVEEILGVLDSMPLVSELILVDDGSHDSTGQKAFGWQEADSRVRVVQFRRNYGQTAGISAGFDHSRGRVVVLMDGDQQNDPRDIPKLLEVMAQGYDVVSGWRADRKDKLLLRRIPSGLANALISRITGTRLHDYGCTLKAYDAEVVRHLRLYGELHRFIPALASMSGARVIEVPVNHRARTRGSSKYGISRTFRVILDLVTVKFLLAYLDRPMQFFGRIGLVSFGGAVVSALMLEIQRIAGFHILKGETFTSLAVLLTVLAAMFICIGLLGEMVTRVYHEGGSRTSYVVRRRAGFGTRLGQHVDGDFAPEASEVVL